MLGIIMWLEVGIIGVLCIFKKLLSVQPFLDYEDYLAFCLGVLGGAVAFIIGILYTIPTISNPFYKGDK